MKTLRCLLAFQAINMTQMIAQFTYGTLQGRYYWAYSVGLILSAAITLAMAAQCRRTYHLHRLYKESEDLLDKAENASRLLQEHLLEQEDAIHEQIKKLSPPRK